MPARGKKNRKHYICMTVGEKEKTTIILINTINFYTGKRNFNMYL